jgi:hypothetical protein
LADLLHHHGPGNDLTRRDGWRSGAGVVFDALIAAAVTGVMMRVPVSSRTPAIDLWP